ncbi:helix-turn-helix transcriptional regulator [Megasphaera paucivorans]|uniref:DNA-binding transcriptional regulator, XRE-family HTH domain n=1 Tax=Megasphaera paucivorans TaxID=349095 RepID=A0A1G9QF94_9FIRM|nr:helix-turn-helix transcriptional regulator [Megasphaera paucivorans]SDM09643.1 DNA-binding transcriptional regulator, XRE-family HTH domain [Megasphaera paucivorans]
MATIGENIKEARKKAGLTQVELAKLTNLSRSYIGDIEKNRYNPSVSTLKAIANATNAPLDTIIISEKVNPEKSEKVPADLKKYLEQSEVIFDGDTYNLTPEEKDMVMQSLKVAFYAAKRANKRKIDDKTK